MTFRGPRPKSYYLAAAAFVLLVVHVKNTETYATRHDVLVVEVIFLGVMLGAAALLGIRVINPLHRPGWRNYLHLVPLAAMLLVGAYGWTRDWNPGGQLRKPGPWRDWDIPDARSAAGEAYRFAHAIKLPDPYVPDGFYREGLFGVFGRTTRLEYIEHLCKNWAGEFIYRKVRDVEGVAQLRGRDFENETDHLYERYRWEDPYSYRRRASVIPYAPFLWNEGYQFFESGLIIDERFYAASTDSRKAPEAVVDHVYRGRANRGDNKFWRPKHAWETKPPLRWELSWRYLVRRPVFSGGPYWRFELVRVQHDHEWLTTSTGITAQNIETLSARYGYTWRGLRLPGDREYGIAGSELIVLDLQTNEVLGFRRGFVSAIQSYWPDDGIEWEFAYRCPFPVGEDLRDPDYAFVKKLLIPINKE